MKRTTSRPPLVDEPLPVIGIPVRLDGTLTRGRIEFRRREDEDEVLREFIARPRPKRKRKAHG